MIYGIVVAVCITVMMTFSPKRIFIGTLWIAVCMHLLRGVSAGEELPRVMDIEVETHRNFHRLVVVLSERVRFNVKKEPSRVAIQMRNIDLSTLPPKKPSTSLLKVDGTHTVKDKKGRLTDLIVQLKGVSKVKEGIMTKPFRIFIDVYPEGKTKKGKGTGRNKGAKAGNTKGLDTVGTDSTLKRVSKRDTHKNKKGLKETVAGVKSGGGHGDKKKEGFKRIKADPGRVVFNDGWRWLYRRKINRLIMESIIENDSLSMEVLRRRLGLKGEDRFGLLMEAQSMVVDLKAKGEVEKAQVLETILLFINGEKEAEGLEEVLRIHPDTGLSSLGFFLLGDYYEKKGFYPEGSGYFGRAIDINDDEFIRASSLFRKARILFATAKFSSAVEWFRKAHKAGFKEAEVWIGNIYLIRGRIRQAWSVYKRVKVDDPLSLLSLGDINIIKGNYSIARRLFSRLASMYHGDPFVSTFFKVRAGDAYLAEGDVEKAVDTYSKIAKEMKGEGMAMASLALADAYSATENETYLKEAERIYREVADGGYVGSEMALLRLVSIQERLKKYGPAVKNVERFLSMYPSSQFVFKAKVLRSRIAYKWIASLSEQGDHYNTVRVGLLYEQEIAFSKKAITFLGVGKAMAELGLDAGAVRNLNNAIRIGKDRVKEEAMVVLAGVYLQQNDGKSAERLLSHFMGIFPRSRYMDRARRLLMEAYYMNGEYAKVADMELRDRDARYFFVKAESLRRLGRYRESESAYRKAIGMYREAGDVKGFVDSSSGLAEVYFLTERYMDAIKEYRKVFASIDERYRTDKLWILYRLAGAYSKLNMDNRTYSTIEELKKYDPLMGKWADLLVGENYL